MKYIPILNVCKITAVAVRMLLSIVVIITSCYNRKLNILMEKLWGKKLFKYNPPAFWGHHGLPDVPRVKPYAKAEKAATEEEVLLLRAFKNFLFSSASHLCT